MNSADLIYFWEYIIYFLDTIIPYILEGHPMTQFLKCVYMNLKSLKTLKQAINTQIKNNIFFIKVFLLL